MRKMNLRLILALMVSLPLLLITSCKTDDPDPEPGDEFLPVLDENFSFTVNGNDVVFTTTINGNVWVTTNNVDYQFADKTVTVNLPLKGTYSFTCSSLGSGEKLTSAAFNVEIEEDNLDHLNSGLWKYLSGGANETKTWKLDMNADADLKWFVGPMFYSGYANGDERKTEWSYWAWDVLADQLPYEVNGVEQTSFFNWSPDYAGNTWLMAARDYGTITFDATNGTVSTNIFGETKSGSFTFNPETWKMTLTGVVLPIDTGRLNEPQYLDENLANVRIFSLTDSAMQIGIKRSFEGFAEDGTQNVSEWVNVYNFIVDGYTYLPETFTWAEPVNTSFTQTDLVGTWKYASVPFDWVGWGAVGSKGTIVTPIPLNNWADAASMLGTTWLGISQAQLDAGAALEFVFNTDGSCTIGGTANTYTVESGVITFGSDATFNIGDHWFSLTGTTFKVLEAEGAVAGGIWIGYQNESKNESSSVHLIKQ